MHGIGKPWNRGFEIFSIALALLVFLPLSLSASDEAVAVGTSAGHLRGIVRSTGGAEFLGIPFAKPPVGKLRWHEPVKVEPWTGVRDASKFGAPCAQPVLGDWNKHDAESSKEDCLFLNVITPVWPPKAKLPVMFWLHGGANAGGTGAGPLYNSGTLVQHGVVLETVNYRLGVFGFFAHPGLTSESTHKLSGNYGLMDQIAALQWVKKNIAEFGRRSRQHHGVRTIRGRAGHKRANDFAVGKKSLPAGDCAEWFCFDGAACPAFECGEGRRSSSGKTSGARGKRHRGIFARLVCS